MSDNTPTAQLSAGDSASRDQQDNNRPSAGPSPGREREPGWIHTIVSRWSNFAWTWIVRALWIALVVLVVLSVLWSLGTDEGADEANVEVLDQRTFTQVTQQAAPQKGAQLPLIGGLFDGGTYSVADFGRCSFIVEFDGGVPVVTFTLPAAGGEVEVRDADPTRLHSVPSIRELCG